MLKFMGVLLLCFELVGAAGVTAQDERLTVVASFSILADVAANVAGDAADVSSLIPLGADPHTFAVSPQDLVTLATADIVFTNGAFFEEGLLDTIENASADIAIIEVSRCVEILPFGEDSDDDHTSTTTTDPLCAAHEAELGRSAPTYSGLGRLYALECDPEHREEDDHEHAVGNCDPHVWTDVDNVKLWTLLIRDTLREQDPAHAEIYSANAAAYLAELDALQQDILAMIETLPTEKRILVTNHEAFAYFAHAYGFEVVGTVIPSASTLAEPSAAELAALIKTIEQLEIAAIFAETTTNNTLVQQVAAETGITVLTLYSGSLNEGDTFLDYMRYNTQTIVEGLNR